ncbi:hypothetical protein GCM10018789_08380 [Streptomyces werraensis]|nr:hypothetical protein GCM10018789_08380 [Streptomyces werraensis]
MKPSGNLSRCPAASNEVHALSVTVEEEAGPHIPLISANQVSMWAALRRWGTRAVGPCRAPIDASARSGTVTPGRTPAVLPGRAAPGPVLPEAPGEKQQEGWT